MKDLMRYGTPQRMPQQATKRQMIFGIT